MSEAIQDPVDPLASGWDYPSPHRREVRPQAADIDGLNHTNNAVYVRWCEEAGWAHSNALGLTLAVSTARCPWACRISAAANRS